MSDLYARELPPTHAARAAAEAEAAARAAAEPVPPRDSGVFDLVLDTAVTVAGGILGLMAVVAIVKALL